MHILIQHLRKISHSHCARMRENSKNSILTPRKHWECCCFHLAHHKSYPFLGDRDLAAQCEFNWRIIGFHLAQISPHYDFSSLIVTHCSISISKMRVEAHVSDWVQTSKLMSVPPIITSFIRCNFVQCSWFCNYIKLQFARKNCTASRSKLTFETTLEFSPTQEA